MKEERKRAKRKISKKAKKLQIPQTKTKKPQK